MSREWVPWLTELPREGLIEERSLVKVHTEPTGSQSQRGLKWYGGRQLTDITADTFWVD